MIKNAIIVPKKEMRTSLMYVYWIENNTKSTYWCTLEIAVWCFWPILGLNWEAKRLLCCSCLFNSK